MLLTATSFAYHFASARKIRSREGEVSHGEFSYLFLLLPVWPDALLPSLVYPDNRDAGSYEFDFDERPRAETTRSGRRGWAARYKRHPLFNRSAKRLSSLRRVADTARSPLTFHASLRKPRSGLCRCCYCVIAGNGPLPSGTARRRRRSALEERATLRGSLEAPPRGRSPSIETCETRHAARRRREIKQ